MDFVLVFFLNVSNFIILIHSNQSFTVPPRWYQSVGGTRSFRKFNHVLFESCASRHSSGPQIGANQKQDDGNVEYHNNLQIKPKRKLYWQTNSSCTVSLDFESLGTYDKCSDIRVALHYEKGPRKEGAPLLRNWGLSPLRLLNTMQFVRGSLFDTKFELERGLFKTKLFIHVQVELYWQYFRAFQKLMTQLINAIGVPPRIPQ